MAELWVSVYLDNGGWHTGVVNGLRTIVGVRLLWAVIYPHEVKMGDDAKPKLKMTVKKVLKSRETSSVSRDLKTFDLVFEVHSRQCKIQKKSHDV